MNRQNRVSEESLSSAQTEDPDFDIENIQLISPESINESISRSVELTIMDKTCIQQLLWFVLAKQIQPDLAKHCILQILKSDIDVYETFVNYLDQCEIFEIS